MDDFLAAHPLGSDIERERALAILDRVRARAGLPCPACGEALVGPEIVESVVLGHQEEPLCHSCLAAEHGEEPAEFLARMREYIARVPCFLAAWTWAGERHGRPGGSA